MHCMSLSNALRADLAHADATELSCLHILCNVTNRLLNRNFGVDSSTLKNVEELLAIEHTETFVNATLYVGLAAINCELAR
jgi:hypothetical protein